MDAAATSVHLPQAVARVLLAQRRAIDPIEAASVRRPTGQGGGSQDAPAEGDTFDLRGNLHTA